MSWKSRTVLATTSPLVVAGAGVMTVGTTTAWTRDEGPSAGASLSATPNHEPEVTSGYQSEHGIDSGDGSHEGDHHDGGDDD